MLRSVALLMFAAGAFSSAEASARLTEANNFFGVNLLKTLSTDKNHVFISPFSVSTAMSMVYHGSRGVSEKELFDVLGFKSAGFDGRETVFAEVQDHLQGSRPRDKNVTFEVANGVLVNKNFPVSASYKKDLEDVYQARFKEVDFVNESERVISEINGWVSEKTKGKIDKVVSKLSVDTVLFLMNAVYFKGSWKSKFLESHTRKLPFYNHGNTAAQVDTMTKSADFRHATSKELNADILELPYAGKEFNMLVVLPHERDGLANLLTSITSSKLRDALSRLHPKTVNVKLPKFKLESEYSLVQQLKDLGAQSIFAGNADLTGMNESGQLYVSDVIHKAVVEVNEEGSEAAAFTGVVVGLRSARIPPSRPVHFNVDHPFLFFIRKRDSNLILFAGAVNQL